MNLVKKKKNLKFYYLIVLFNLFFSHLDVEILPDTLLSNTHFLKRIQTFPELKTENIFKRFGILKSNNSDDYNDDDDDKDLNDKIEMKLNDENNSFKDCISENDDVDNDIEKNNDSHDDEFDLIFKPEGRVGTWAFGIRSSTSNSIFLFLICFNFKLFFFKKNK